jgi:hypothetical protein
LNPGPQRWQVFYLSTAPLSHQTLLQNNRIFRRQQNNPQPKYCICYFEVQPSSKWASCRFMRIGTFL